MTKQAVDAILLRKIDGKYHVLLIKRKKNPYLGMYALVGGKVEQGESMLQAVAREVEEEVGIKGIEFQKVGEFVNEANWHSTAFLGFVMQDIDFQENAEVSGINWIALDEVPTLASNHNDMIEAAKNIIIF